MRHKIYLRVEASSQDLMELQEAIDTKVVGRICRRRHDGSPLVDVGLDYWESKEEFSQNEALGDKLLSLAAIFFDAVREYLFADRISVTLVVVTEYGVRDEPCGYFFPAKLIKLIGDNCADIDIDSVRDMSSNLE